jgi:hypothetical protein
MSERSIPSLAGIDAKFMMLSLVFSARKRVQTASLRMCVWYFAYHFSGEAMDIKKYIDRLNGTLFVNQKTKAV